MSQRDGGEVELRLYMFESGAGWLVFVVAVCKSAQ